jgi:hypothetical protein
VTLGLPHFQSLDLETGATHASGAFTGSMFPVPRDTAPDGATSLVVVLHESKQQLWLMRAAGGAPRLLAEATVVSGLFSPDGQHVLVSTLQRADDTTRTALWLMDVAGDAKTSLGEGWQGLWLRP